MCNPQAAVMIVTAVMSAYQQREQGQFEEGVAKYNARQGENEAVRTRNAGVEAENIHREKVAQLISQQRAAIGAGNLDLDSGSSLRLVTDSESMGDADALRIRSNYEDRAKALESGAALSLAEGKNARKQANIGATTTLVKAAGSAYGGYSSYMQEGQEVSVQWYQQDGSLSSPQRLR